MDDFGQPARHLCHGHPGRQHHQGIRVDVVHLFLGDQVSLGIDFAAGFVDIHVHAVAAGLFRAALTGGIFGGFKVIGLVIQGHLAVVFNAELQGFDVDQAPVDGFQVSQALVGNGDVAIEPGDRRQHVSQDIGGEEFHLVYADEQVAAAFAPPVHTCRGL